MIRIKEKAFLDYNLIKHIAQTLNVSERFSKILVSRGIDSVETAKKFLNPSLLDLYDPLLLDGVSQAVERIKLAKENAETVVIYGDYDADGISAVTVLCRSLKIFGIDAIAVIPERENGYGLSKGMIDAILENYYPDLIITVDCGISAVKEVEELQDLGVDVIVTDHHEIPEEIPSCTVINCKMKGNYPFDGLCGAGVAYKLARALIGQKADKFLDIVAVATVADSMPLVSENRIIVSEGVKLIKSGKCNPMLSMIAKVGGLKEVTATSIAYTIAPRVNAAGRMDNARLALDAFLSDDIEEIENYAKALNEYNAKRQFECDLLYRTAKSMILEKSPDNRVIALRSADWKSGLIGIVAAKLVEEFSKPVVLFTEREGLLHGSARSVAGVNIFKAFSQIKEYTEDYGGHSQAAGVTLKVEKFEEFEKALNQYLIDNCDVSDFITETEIEEVLTEKFTVDFAKELNLLEPFGIANKKPLFAVECERAFASPTKIGSTHIAFKHNYIELLMFGGVDKLPVLNSEIKKLIIFESNVSIFNGRESLKGYVKEIHTIVDGSDGEMSAVYGLQLNSINSRGNYIEIDDSIAEKMLKTASKEIYGTLFIVNDVKTLDKFKDTGRFAKSVITPDGKGNLCIITLGTDGKVPDGYSKVVYLDKPLSVMKTDKQVFVNTMTRGYNLSVSTQREVLGRVFLAIKNRPQGILSATELIEETNLSIFQIVFSLSVFIELGLVIPQSGRYKAVNGIKRDLTDSSLYKSIKRIFG